MEKPKNEDMNPAMNKSEEGEEQEEVEMEMFFALLRSFREARDRRTELDELQRSDVNVDGGNGSSSRKKKKLQDVTQASWIPSFEWEDFTKEVEFRGAPLAFPAPVLEQKEKLKDDGLDLNLAL